MKFAHVLILNLFTVGVALAAYHVVTAPEPASTEVAAAAEDDEGLAERVASLERQVRALGGRTSGRDLAATVADVQRRLAAVEETDPEAAAEGSAAAAESDAPVEHTLEDALEIDPDASPAEIARIRKLMDAADAERSEEEAAERVDRLLDRLELDLTKKQREQLVVALGEFRDKIRNHFRSARGEGLTREETHTGMEDLRAEFTTGLQEFLSATDAELIAESVGRGPPGGGRRGGPGGRRGGG
jgi:hypothetical protein